MVSVHCLAYPVLRIGMSKGLSGLPRALSQGPGKGRIEALFTIHARPSAKQKNAVDRGGAPGGACAVSTFQRLRARAAAAMQRVTPSI
jgi:hypothetical protein